MNIDGEPRLELMKGGEMVDKIRIGRYDLKSVRNILSELGLKRDESQTWEKKSAQIKLEQAFNQPHKPLNDEL